MRMQAGRREAGAVGLDEAARVRLAARASTPVATLRMLAEDAAITVRAAVAMNPAYAPAVDRRLLADGDARVRALLGAKVARLLPGLSGAEHAAAQAHVHGVLGALARDAAELVRIAVSDAVGHMPEAPRAVILSLAQDAAAAVSGPVIRLSPLLTEADLLELLAAPAHGEVDLCVASRAGVGAAVADHIARHAGSLAVQALLANPTALIQEATLDGLIGRAGDHPEWHEPLVRRPALPVRAALALSQIVAAELLEILAGRPDMPPRVVERVRERLQMAISPCPPPLPSEAEVFDAVRNLNASGQLTEGALIEALQAGEHRQGAAILAVLAGVPLLALDRAIGLRSAKALVSIVWKAGFTMRAAALVQSVLGRFPPGEQLGPAVLGTFPLSPAEMEWQIELLGEPAR